MKYNTLRIIRQLMEHELEGMELEMTVLNKDLKKLVAVCIAVVWIGMLVCIAGMKRTAKEHLRWYVWYALIVSVIATAEMLLITGSAK